MHDAQERTLVFLPVCLNISNVRIVMIGGGRVAEHKLNGLLRFTKAVTVVAPEVSEAIRASGVTVRAEAYHAGVLEGAGLVYACTNDAALNRQVREDAHARGLLVNVADAPELCDFVSPAVVVRGEMAIAVSSQARNVKRAIAWRDRIGELLDDDQFDGL